MRVVSIFKPKPRGRSLNKNDGDKRLGHNTPTSFASIFDFFSFIPVVSFEKFIFYACFLTEDINKTLCSRNLLGGDSCKIFFFSFFFFFFLFF
jgi:hypothetical protein